MESVLETMFFAMADGEADPMDPLPPDSYRMGMSFDGACEGRFEVRIAKEAAHRIAESFSGVADPDDLTEGGVLEVVGELTNMICGSMLSQWAEDKIFSLSTPSRIAAPNVPDRPAALSVASRAFVLDGGVLAAEMELTGCRP